MRYAVLVPASFFAAAVYLWFVASSFRGGVGRYELIGPSFFPKILLIAIIALTAVEVVRTLVAQRRRAEAASGEAPDGTKAGFYPLDLALAVGITIGYVVALHWIGFILSTIAFQALLLFTVFRQRRWRIALGVPVVLTTVFFVIFIELMSVPLPRGHGIFHQLNRLIY